MCTYNARTIVRTMCTYDVDSEPRVIGYVHGSNPVRAALTLGSSPSPREMFKVHQPREMLARSRPLLVSFFLEALLVCCRRSPADSVNSPPHSGPLATSRRR